MIVAENGCEDPPRQEGEAQTPAVRLGDALRRLEAGVTALDGRREERRNDDRIPRADKTAAGRAVEALRRELRIVSNESGVDATSGEPELEGRVEEWLPKALEAAEAALIELGRPGRAIPALQRFRTKLDEQVWHQRVFGQQF